MAQILLDHWEIIAQIIALVSSMVAMYFKMKNEVEGFKQDLVQFKNMANEHWTRQDVEFDKLDVRFDDHVNDPLPHQSCPAHAQALADIVPRLDRIQGDIGSLRDDLGAFKTSILTIMTTSAAKK